MPRLLLGVQVLYQLHAREMVSTLSGKPRPKVAGAGPAWACLIYYMHCRAVSHKHEAAMSVHAIVGPDASCLASLC